MSSRKARILILCKTYPSPSARHVETSCVAGLDGEGGPLIRIFPVPFRLIDGARQFKKWQWIEARIEKAKRDHRRESHRIFVDTIRQEKTPLSTEGGWRLRREALNHISIFSDFGAIEQAHSANGTTLGILRPTRVIGLEITPSKKPDWSDDQRKKLIGIERQGKLFASAEVRKIAMLRKIPFDFHYRYECDVSGLPAIYEHKIVDWEIGALYWKVRESHGENWQRPFRAKLEDMLPASDLMFLMGNQHRFHDQWLIVSLLYPPRLPTGVQRQQSLL